MSAAFRCVGCEGACHRPNGTPCALCGGTGERPEIGRLGRADLLDRIAELEAALAARRASEKQPTLLVGSAPDGFSASAFGDSLERAALSAVNDLAEAGRWINYARAMLAFAQETNAAIADESRGKEERIEDLEEQLAEMTERAERLLVAEVKRAEAFRYIGVRTEGELFDALKERDAAVSRLVAALREHATMLENLTATQTVSTRLTNELRGFRRIIVGADVEGIGPGLQAMVGAAFAAECKHGPFSPRLDGIPDGTGDTLSAARVVYAQDACSRAERQGCLTWRLLAEEEAAEVFAETDPAKLRAELAQLGAVCAAWIAALDRRAFGVLEIAPPVAEESFEALEAEDKVVRIDGGGK